MSDDDDDVSIIALSDDEGSKPSQTTKASAAPAATSYQRVSFAPDTAVGGSKKGGHRSGGKHEHGRKGSSRAVEPVVYEEDENEDEDEQSDVPGPYDEEDEEEGGSYRDTVLDEEGLDYISDRFARRSRQEHGSGPCTWLEVNEAEIKEVMFSC